MILYLHAVRIFSAYWKSIRRICWYAMRTAWKLLLHFAGFAVFIYRRGKGGDYFGKHEMENPQNRKHPTCRSCLVFAAGHLCICVSLLAVQHYRRCAEYGREPFGSTSDFLDWLCGNALYLDGFSGILYSTVCPQIGLSFCRRGEEVYRK